MAKNRKKIGLKPGLNAAGPVLSQSEARVLAERKNKTVEQVMSRALDKGLSLGSALVNSYNRGAYGSSPYGSTPENLAGLAGLRLEKGQVYSGTTPSTLNGVTTQFPNILSRDQARAGYTPLIGSNTSYIPGVQVGAAGNEGPVPGQVPAAPVGAQTEAQTQNVEKLQESVRTRAGRMEEFKRKLKEAEEQTAQLRADTKAKKAAEEARRNESLAAERANSAELEKQFRARLANIQDDYSVARQNRTSTSEEDRQARMIREFERASRGIERNPDYSLRGFKDRFSDFQAITPEGAVPTEGGEEAASPLTYQELLDRLKQYKQGGF